MTQKESSERLKWQVMVLEVEELKENNLYVNISWFCIVHMPSSILERAIGACHYQ